MINNDVTLTRPLHIEGGASCDQFLQHFTSHYLVLSPRDLCVNKSHIDRVMPLKANKDSQSQCIYSLQLAQSQCIYSLQLAQRIYSLQLAVNRCQWQTSTCYWKSAVHKSFILSNCSFCLS